jgi:hypothetical protein
MLKLKPKEIELLKQCLNEHRPDLLWVVDSPHIVNLDHKLGGELLNAVGDHFVQYGLRPDEEPNPFGLELEYLNDAMSRLYIRELEG